MDLSAIGRLFGGLGLFLLGMRLMTDGLKFAAGDSLRTILAGSTRTMLRGILSGLFLTSLVQSSSAVTVAAIGFVNAGLMGLAQAVPVIYGSNIGTTMTGWLVSVVGFHVNVQAFALPAVGGGVLLRLSSGDSRRGALGDVLVGFGIFFLGIDILKDTFAGIGASIPLAKLAGRGALTTVLFAGIGFFLTLVMQSSSAAMAVILTAVAGAVIGLQEAAAAVIGANLGTTSTAALAVIGATSNAKRVASAHVAFNLITGVVALLLLPGLTRVLLMLQADLVPSATPAIFLALFHTVFNLMGVLLMVPLSGFLVRILLGRFRTAEEDEARPRYLDRNVVGTPVLAMHALEKELQRIGGIAKRMAKGAISAEVAASPRLAGDKETLDRLIAATADFSNTLQRSNLPPELDNVLPNALRVSGYHSDLAELAISMVEIRRHSQHLEEPELAELLARFKSRAVALLDRYDIEHPDYSVEGGHQQLENFRDEYRSLKAALLRAAAKGQLSSAQMVIRLDMIAAIRHMVEQAEKGARYMASLVPEREEKTQPPEKTEENKQEAEGAR